MIFCPGECGLSLWSAISFSAVFEFVLPCYLHQLKKSATMTFKVKGSESWIDQFNPNRKCMGSIENISCNFRAMSDVLHVIVCFVLRDLFSMVELTLEL